MPDMDSSSGVPRLPILSELNIKEDISIKDGVTDWIDCYKRRESANDAIADMLNFILACSGCKARLDKELLKRHEFTEIIQKVTLEFDEDSSEYPLIASNQHTRNKVKQNLSEFINYFVDQIKNSFIYNHELMDSMLGFLTQLSDSQVRAFRHTSTFMAMKFLTATLKVLLEAEENLTAIEKQGENEEKRSSDRQNLPRLQILKKTLEEQKGNVQELKNIWEFAFSSIFSNRYRDSFPDVRVVCIEELGHWMILHPEKHVDDQYLKYIGWMFFDKSASVRLECLNAIMPLLENPELTSSLQLFCKKFKKRLVMMLNDVDSECSVQAMNVVKALNETHPDILSENDREKIYELCFVTNRPLAQAAGEFLDQTIRNMHKGSQRTTKTASGKKRHKFTAILIDIVIFFIESEVHTHTAYLVDALIDCSEVLTTWEVYTDLLLEDPGPEEDPLEPNQETVIIGLLSNAVKYAATGQPPFGRGSVKKLTAREKKQLDSETNKMTKHMITVLPKILRKYSTDEKKVTLLLKMIKSLNIDVFSVARAGKELEEFFDVILDVMTLHQETTLLRAGSQALEHLTRPGSNVEEHANRCLSRVIDEFVCKLDEALTNFIQTPNDSTEFSLNGSFKRSSIIISYNDMSGRYLFDRAISILRDAPGSVTEELLISADLVCFHEIVWHLHKAFDSEIDRESINKIGFIREDYLKLVTAFVTQADSHPLVAAKCFSSICDLLIFFSSSLGEHYQHLKVLVINVPIEDEIRQALLKYFQQHVLPYDTSCDYDRNESEKVNEERMQDVLNHRRRMTGYMKLILTGIVPLRDTALILQFYTRTKCYSDIFKWFVTKLREVDKERCCEQMFNTLVRMYENYLYKLRVIGAEPIAQDQAIPVDRDSDEFHDMKDLARRFVMLFGIDSEKMKRVTNAFHQLVYRYVLGPTLTEPKRERLPFLEAVSDFTIKMTTKDKLAIIGFVESKIVREKLITNPIDLELINQYKLLIANFVNNVDDGYSLPGGGEPPMKRKRGRPKKRSESMASISDTRSVAPSEVNEDLDVTVF